MRAIHRSMTATLMVSLAGCAAAPVRTPVDAERCQLVNSILVAYKERMKPEPARTVVAAVIVRDDAPAFDDAVPLAGCLRDGYVPQEQLPKGKVAEGLYVKLKAVEDGYRFMASIATLPLPAPPEIFVPTCCMMGGRARRGDGNWVLTIKEAIPVQ